MPILQRSNRKSAAREQINIRGVRDGLLLLPRNNYRVVLEVSSVNFELKSEEEQDVLIDTYESFLNSLPCPVQILVRIRELDMSNYLSELQSRISEETEDVYRSQIKNYSEFVQELVADNSILSRHFYVIIPFTADDFETAKEQLAINADMVAKGLMRLGMRSRQLGSLEVLDLFHSYYSPERAKCQPLTDQVAGMLSSSFIQGEKS